MVKIKGEFLLQHYRSGKLINEIKVHNGIVDVGKNAILDIMFHGSAQIATWYIGLIDNDSYSSVSASDTMSSHSGWIESDDYSEGNRQAWVEGAASNKSITSSSSSDFSINATKTIKGFFVTSDNTKNGTSGTLWSTALLSSTVAVENGDTLKLTYTVSIT